MNIASILCPVDFSSCSEAAARLAASLARDVGADVHLLHVLPLPLAPMPVAELGLAPQEVVVPSYATDLDRDARSALRRLATDLCLEPHVHVTVGSAAREIVRIAEAMSAGMIVLGTHGRTGLAHWLLGSVAERVVRTAHVPVLVVPEKRPPS